MPAEAPGHSPLIGQTLGHYRILEKIGAGGMGEVYRAQDEHLEREVAIKVLPLGTLADETSRRRFRQEALALSRLNHPNIATIYDFDTHQGLDFLVMEYIPGVTLRDRLSQGSFPEKQVVALGTQLAEGLSAAHEHGVVHRDLKPSNLELTSDGRLKILDFGLAKLRSATAAGPATETLTETQALIGTLPYMAPEQVLGGVIDPRTDIHAAGAVLYEMATGQRPFAKVGSSELVAAILRSSPTPVSAVNPRLSPELERIIGKCLEKEMEERFQSAKELALDLRRLTRDRGSGSASKEAPALASSHIVRRRATALAAVAVVVSLVLVAAIFWLARIRKASEAARIQPPMAASIAVLPFADLSPTHDHEYFCEGLAEEILNKLTKIPNLRVAARTSAFQFKRQNQDLRDIGQKLDVANILEGSVQREANRVRITVHLTKIDAGLSLWSENYDREFQDIFAVEDDIASAVTASLQPALLGRQTSVTLPPPQTANPEAYQAFLQARYFMRNSNLESEQKAFVYINKAIQFDPNYAPAYALRAVMTAEAGFNGRIVNVSTAIRESRRDAEKAISLDPNLPAAYLALSESQATGDWDWRAAQQSVRKARELAPGDADALLQSGFLTMCQGRLEEAAELMNQGLAIDPLAPGKHTMLAEILLYLGRYDAALQALEKAPFQNTTHEVRGEAYLAQGQAQDALVEMEKESEEAWRDFGMAMAYYALHRGKDSDAALTQLRAKYGQVAASQIAEAYAYRNERDQAFHWLERARLQHDSGLGRIKVNWLLKNLRNDPRFARLLQQVNLAE